MDPNFPEATRLIRKVLSGPPGATEITTESGRVLRVERDPEPGIELRLAPVDSDIGPGDWLVMSLRAAEEKPEGYPPSVPFVPLASGVVAIFGENITVAWRSIEAAACPVPNLEPDAGLEELAERLKSLMESVQGSEATSSAEVAEKVKAINDSLDPDTRAKLEELWQHLQPEADVLNRLERVFEAVFEASVEDGWRVADNKATETPFRTIRVELERGDYSRLILMLTMFGAGSSVILEQNPRESGAAA